MVFKTFLLFVCLFICFFVCLHFLFSVFLFSFCFVFLKSSKWLTGLYADFINFSRLADLNLLPVSDPSLSGRICVRATLEPTESWGENQIKD